MLAGMEQIARRCHRGGVQPFAVLQDRFSDRRGGKVQPFAELLLQQAQNCRVKFLNVIGGGEPRQIRHALAHQAGGFPVPPQAGVGGQFVLLPAPEHGANPGQGRKRL